MTQSTSDIRGKELLRSLIGEKVSSVEFVENYVQMHFNGPSLTMYTMPTVTAGGVVFKDTEPLSRDGLCGLIGKKAIATDVDADALVVIFDDESSVSVSLRDEDQRGPEAVMMQTEKGWNVW